MTSTLNSNIIMFLLHKILIKRIYPNICITLESSPTYTFKNRIRYVPVMVLFYFSIYNAKNCTYYKRKYDFNKKLQIYNTIFSKFNISKNYTKNFSQRKINFVLLNCNNGYFTTGNQNFIY